MMRFTWKSLANATLNRRLLNIPKHKRYFGAAAGLPMEAGINFRDKQMHLDDEIPDKLTPTPILIRYANNTYSTIFSTTVHLIENPTSYKKFASSNSS